MPNIGLPELLLLALLVMLLFGSTRLPKLARSMREAREEFEKGGKDEAPSSEKPSEKPSS